MEKEIRKILLEIIELLEIVGEYDWRSTLKRLYADNVSPQKDWLRKIKSLFGGMGSFTDLVLMRNGIFCIDENNKLDQLVKSKILTRYYFTSEEGKGIYRIYCLEKMGKYLLTSKEIECKWQQTDNVKPVPMIKKRLAGNQTIIAYLRKVKAFDSYVVKPALTAKISGKVFKATGGSVKLTKNKKSITFLFEVIRREPDWQKKLADKMALYKEFYENFVPGDSGFAAMPQLIFVCEDDKHTAEAFKEIVKNKLEISQIKLYFTTDLRQNQETLENTLIEFKIDENTQKYKMYNVEAKILGI